jgi:predicted methyltransferase
MKAMIEGNEIYLVEGKKRFKPALFSDHYYALKLFNGIPILEIDGVRMHLVKDFGTPLEYSKEVVEKLGIRKTDFVLDCCGGLGYTAIAASKFAKKVISCEIKKEILELASYSQFSKEYFKSKNIEIRNADISSEIKKFEEEQFDKIIHDPPRFSHAPELYSSEFYKELFRVLNRGGILFHYVGSLGKGRGRKIEKEVEHRLEAAGFSNFRFDEKLQGVFAKK